MHSRELVNVCGKAGTSETVCYVCETGGEPVLPLWLKWEAKINMGVYALEWKRSKCEFSFHILFQFVFIHRAWVKPRPVISRELIVWTCTRDTCGWCIVRQHDWCCLNIVSALNAQVRLSYCGRQTGEMCLLQSSRIRMYEAWKGHTVIALREPSFRM